MSPAWRAVKPLGIERGVFDRLGVAQHGSGDDLAEFDVEARVVTGLVDQAEARYALVHAAAQRAALLHLGQQAAATAASATGGLFAALVAGAIVVVIAAGSRGEQAERGEQAGETSHGRSSDHWISLCCRGGAGLPLANYYGPPGAVSRLTVPTGRPPMA